jgi:hypothetical protein
MLSKDAIVFTKDKKAAYVFIWIGKTTSIDLKKSEKLEKKCEMQYKKN